MPDDRIALGWIARATPIPARAAVASGPAARSLAHRLAALDDAALAALTAVAGTELLIVLGDADALPWVDGVLYLGRDPAAPGLLLPTALEPTVPAAALALAVRGHLRDAVVAVVPSPLTLIPCSAARAIDRARLAAWL